MIKSFQKILVLSATIMFVGFFATVSITNAQTPKPSAKTPATTSATDPCDKLQTQISNGGFDVKGSLPVYCTTGSVYTKFLNWALYAIGIAATIAIIYGGYLYMTASTNEEQRKKGRTVLTWAVVGVAIVVLAAVIVNVVAKLVAT